MASDVDSLRYILDFLKNRKVKAGEVAMRGWFHEPFSKDLWSVSDFEKGLKLGIDNGWLVDEGVMIRLTADGFANYR